MGDGGHAACPRPPTAKDRPPAQVPNSSCGALPTSREEPWIYWATGFPLCPQRDSVLAVASGNKFSFGVTWGWLSCLSGDV